MNLKHCTNTEKKFIQELCEEFPYQFHLEGDKLGTTNITKHEIKLIPGSKIINIRQYRMPHTYKKTLQKILDDFENQGIIEKCQSAYNSPVVLVHKKDDFGTKTDFRLVIDYRKLNEITEIENFPIPLIDDILDGLNGSSYFTTLDLKGAFYHIKLDEKSKRIYSLHSRKLQIPLDKNANGPGVSTTHLAKGCQHHFFRYDWERPLCLFRRCYNIQQKQRRT